MCKPRNDRRLFFRKGEAKGWSLGRIERAWAAHEQQRAREDARVLMAAPPPPPPLAVGERVTGPWGSTAWEIVAIDAGIAWLRQGSGHIEAPLFGLTRAAPSYADTSPPFRVDL